jgi:hypothetical protein
MYLDIVITECPVQMKAWPLGVLDIASVLEVCKDPLNRALADISVHRDFIQIHDRTEANDYPLNIFGNGFALNHGEGNAVR